MYHIKDNQLFYISYFKLSAILNGFSIGYDLELAKLFYNNTNIDYHIEFFSAGFNAVIKKWLNEGCKKTPEEIESIIKDEYKSKNKEIQNKTFCISLWCQRSSYLQLSGSNND